jgi:hypothetical protein
LIVFPRIAIPYRSFFANNLLGDVKKSRDFGSLGLCKLWKQLKERPSPFPIYRNGISSGKIYEDLGELKIHRQLAVD